MEFVGVAGGGLVQLEHEMLEDDHPGNSSDAASILNEDINRARYLVRRNHCVEALTIKAQTVLLKSLSKVNICIFEKNL